MEAQDFNRLQRGLELLTLGNPKTMKGLAQDYLTAILHLAPAWSSGRNVCAFHSEACAEDCLSYSGRGAMKKVQAARVRRTKEYFDDVRSFCISCMLIFGWWLSMPAGLG